MTIRAKCMLRLVLVCTHTFMAKWSEYVFLPTKDLGMQSELRKNEVCQSIELLLLVPMFSAGHS